MHIQKPISSAFRNKALLCVAAASAYAFGPCVSNASAQTPLYEWNFNGQDAGANTGSGTGGELSPNVGLGTPTDGTFSSPGVSGNAGDSAFNTNGSFNYGTYSYTTSGDAGSIGGLNFGSGLSQFTITGWVQYNPGNPYTTASIFAIDNPGSPSNGSNPGISLETEPIYDNNGALVATVNGNQNYTGSLLPGNASLANQWVFFSLSYDGTTGATNPYYYVYNPSSTDLALYGTTADTVVMAGTASTLAAPNANGFAESAAGLVALDSSSSIIIGNNGTDTDELSGSVDDLRIYDTELSVAQIDAIQAQGLNGDIVAAPEPSASVLILGGIGLLILRLRKRQSVSA
jgi:hypothetical protein